MVDDAGSWAQEEFGEAELGDKRRTKRLVAMASRAAASPSGKITAVFVRASDREGAYRFMEKVKSKSSEVAAAAHRACANRSKGLPFVFVAEDGSSLNITDDARIKGTGPVGARKMGGRGFQVMNAIAISPDGVPLGVCGQAFWARPERARRKHANRVKTAAKETQRWIDVMAQTREAYAETGVVPWFQMDRGADGWPILQEAQKEGAWVTVRSAHDRRLYVEEDGIEVGDVDDGRVPERAYLRDRVRSTHPLGIFGLDVSGSATRAARTARMELRACKVLLYATNHQTKTRHKIPIWAVEAREVGTAPDDEKPIEWLLLTTHPVEDAGDAALVVFGYSQRWRVEEFHKAWKSAACDVEDTQLRSADAIYAWAAMLASVAVRLMRLTYLPRKKPELLATEELTTDEIKAVYAAAQRPLPRRPPTLATVALLIAQLGGYTGKSSGGPPGTLVMARGWARVEPVVRVLQFLGSAAGNMRSDQW